MSNRQPHPSENALFGHGTGLRRKQTILACRCFSIMTARQAFSIPQCHTGDHNTRLFLSFLSTKTSIRFLSAWKFRRPETTKQTKKGYLKHVPSSPGSVKPGHKRRIPEFHAEENFAYCSKRKITWLKAIPVYTVFMHQKCRNPYKYTSSCISARLNRCFSQPPSASFFDFLLSKKSLMTYTTSQGTFLSSTSTKGRKPYFTTVL